MSLPMTAPLSIVPLPSSLLSVVVVYNYIVVWCTIAVAVVIIVNRCARHAVKGGIIVIVHCLVTISGVVVASFRTFSPLIV